MPRAPMATFLDSKRRGELRKVMSNDHRRLDSEINQQRTVDAWDHPKGAVGAPLFQQTDEINATEENR